MPNVKRPKSGKSKQGEHDFMHAFDGDAPTDPNDTSFDLLVDLSDIEDDPQLIKQTIEDVLAGRPSSTLSSSSASSSSSGSAALPGIRRIENIETSSWRARVTIYHKEYNIYTSRDKTEASLAYIYARMQLQDLLSLTKTIRESDLFINFDKHILRYPHVIPKVDLELIKIRAHSPSPDQSGPRVKRRPGI